MAAQRGDRSRYTDTRRVEAFSDGVFAVAITLLIFTITVPVVAHGRLQHALLDQWPDYAAYAVSFLTIGIIWVNHHATFARIERVDRPLLFINLLLLMTVSFIPFPTNLLSHYIRSGPDARVAALLYACTMTVMAIGFNGIWAYAIYRGLITGIHPRAARSSILRFSTGLLIYGVSIALALVNPFVSLALFAAIAIFYMFDQQSAVPISPPEPDQAGDAAPAEA